MVRLGVIVPKFIYDRVKNEKNDDHNSVYHDHSKTRGTGSHKNTISLQSPYVSTEPTFVPGILVSVIETFG